MGEAEGEPARQHRSPAVGQDLTALEKSIATGWMPLHPIIVARDEDGKLRIIDGRTRHAVCRKLGVTPTFAEFTGDVPVAFIWRENGPVGT